MVSQQVELDSLAEAFCFKETGGNPMGDAVPWIVVGVLIVGLATLGWFIGSGPSWETRRKMNEYRHSPSPRTEDCLRTFVHKGPGEA
jgi:hypothetical protein